MVLRSGQCEMIDFPTDHIFKTVGDNRQGFVDSVHRAVSSIVPIGIDAVKTRQSAGSKYISVSIVVRLDNRQQLEKIYQSLQQIEGVRYLL